MASIISSGPSSQEHALGVEHRRLSYLHDLPDYKVHHDDADVRGWDVVLESGLSIGKVDSLIVDQQAEQVRYLEVESERGFIDTYRDKSNYLDQNPDAAYAADHSEMLMIPIGIAHVDRTQHRVVVPGYAADYFGHAPRYRRGSQVNPRYEIEALHYYDNEEQDRDETQQVFTREAYRDFDEGLFRGLGDGFYKHRMFGRNRFYDRHEKAMHGI